MLPRAAINDLHVPPDLHRNSAARVVQFRTYPLTTTVGLAVLLSWWAAPQARAPGTTPWAYFMTVDGGKTPFSVPPSIGGISPASRVIDRLIPQEWSANHTGALYQPRGSIPLAVALRSVASSRPSHALPACCWAGRDLQPGRVSGH